jgi:hypothetical protein
MPPALGSLRVDGVLGQLGEDLVSIFFFDERLLEQRFDLVETELLCPGSAFPPLPSASCNERCRQGERGFPPLSRTPLALAPPNHIRSTMPESASPEGHSEPRAGEERPSLMMLRRRR